jgi:2-oxoglutarate ferredoxin oxidoreductase subunit gamma
MPKLTEIRVAGFGGQGVILSAMVIVRAYSIYEGGFATLTQSFGTEARGGACTAQIVASTEPVLYPYIARPDILMVMFQEAFTRFLPELKDGGMLIVEENLVRISGVKSGTRLFSCPATRIAEELGNRMVLNIVMVGFFAAVAGLVKPESLRQSVATSVPAHYKEINLTAFEKGYEYGLAKLQAMPNGEPVEGMLAATAS